MNPAIRDHLLTLCLARRLELANQLRFYRATQRPDHEVIGKLVAEQPINDAAIAELDSQQVAA
jgi:hypothetical protein